MILLILLVLPLTVFFSQKQQEYRQHAAGNTNCGVTKNLDGTYHFSWLHVAGGKIVDQNNCGVILVGLNTAGLEFGDASGGDMTQSHIQQLSKMFNMNLWRVAINVSWWNNNNFVSSENMHYQDWIKQQIQWMEQNGNYVEMDPTNYVTISPATGGLPYCSNESNNPPPNPNCIPSQDTLNNPPWTEQQKVTATQQFWNSVVPLYANDPAIVYDALNEPYAPAFTNYYQDLNTMINTIQKLNPKALVFVYANGVDQMVAGNLPDYSQQNLVFDFHPYPDPTNPWQDKFAHIQEWIPWIQNHNHAITIGEWGDPQLANNKPYADAVINMVKTQGVATSYYNEGNMMSNGQLTSQGQVVQQEYASLPPVIGSSTSLLHLDSMV